MKYSLVCAIFFSALLSCNNPKGSDKDSFILGKWRLIKTVVFQTNDDSVNLGCNTCPQIAFIKNHAGFIKRPRKILSYFNWEFDGNELNIKQTGPVPDRSQNDMLNNGIYKITYNQFQEIALFDSVNNVKYILRR